MTIYEMLTPTKDIGSLCHFEGLDPDTKAMVMALLLESIQKSDLENGKRLYGRWLASYANLARLLEKECECLLDSQDHAATLALFIFASCLYEKHTKDAIDTAYKLIHFLLFVQGMKPKDLEMFMISIDKNTDEYAKYIDGHTMKNGDDFMHFTMMVAQRITHKSIAYFAGVTVSIALKVFLEHGSD